MYEVKKKNNIKLLHKILITEIRCIHGNKDVIIAYYTQNAIQIVEATNGHKCTIHENQINSNN